MTRIDPINSILVVTGNVTSLRNRLGVEDLLTKVYHEGPGNWPAGDAEIMPQLLPKVLPLHQVIKVDAFIPGCPPDFITGFDIEKGQEILSCNIALNDYFPLVDYRGTGNSPFHFRLGVWSRINHTKVFHP